MSKLRTRPNLTGQPRYYIDRGDGAPWIPCPADVAAKGKPAVQEWRVAYEATLVKLGATTRKSAAETVDDYFDRWLKDRVAQGIRSTGSDKGRYTKWIKPLIGAKSVALVNRRDLVDVVSHLNGAVKASTPTNHFRGKTARNVFGLVSKMFKDAAFSATPALQVRDDNPARDVQPPAKGIEREGSYLYPAEFLALVSCPRVPVRWKRLITIASYLGCRRGELEALTWSAVNLEQGYVQIHCAVDKETREIKSTKTGTNRKVRIEPSLLPLLAMMRDENKVGRVFQSTPPDEEMATRLRKYLGWAGVTRAELFANDVTRRRISWHDLRHGYASWRIVRGDSQKKVQRAGGWKTPSMLDRYCNEAETFEDLSTFGEVFPALPLDHFRPGTGLVTGGPATAGSGPNSSGPGASPTGFEPVLAA
jgi:integrase